MSGIKQLLIIGFCSILKLSFGQIKVGKIVYERKTNLEKEFKDVVDSDFLDYIKKNKIKKDEFELYFNDTVSIFKPVFSDLADEMSWATNTNTTLHSLASNQYTIVLNMWGQELILEDTLSAKVWQITDSKRVISNYECRKAIWQKNDTTRIYAWYSTEILANAGPEGFCGLPGTILGLATEDGGVIYFAKSVELITPSEQDFIVEKKRKKVFAYQQLYDQLMEDYGNEKWGKQMILELFEWL
jgi:GLPGLI family protein